MAYPAIEAGTAEGEHLRLQAFAQRAIDDLREFVEALRVFEADRSSPRTDAELESVKAAAQQAIEAIELRLEAVRDRRPASPLAAGARRSFFTFW